MFYLYQKKKESKEKFEQLQLQIEEPLILIKPIQEEKQERAIVIDIL